MAKARFEHDVGVLRGLIKNSGLETDPYKIIIYVENFIIEHGTHTTQKTVEFLKDQRNSKERRLDVILDVMLKLKPNINF